MGCINPDEFNSLHHYLCFLYLLKNTLAKGQMFYIRNASKTCLKDLKIDLIPWRDQNNTEWRRNITNGANEIEDRRAAKEKYINNQQILLHPQNLQLFIYVFQVEETSEPRIDFISHIQIHVIGPARTKPIITFDSKRRRSSLSS